jgi:hypothetical protein
MNILGASHFGNSQATSITRTAAAKSNIRKDPSFEYFSMMLITQKIKSQKNEEIMKLDVNKLWMKAIDGEGLTFIDFQDFIEKEINTIK